MVRERRRRIPWACGHRIRTNTQLALPDRGLIPEVRRRAASRTRRLILLATLLFLRSRFRESASFARRFSPGFHVEAVLLYFLDDVPLAAPCV